MVFGVAEKKNKQTDGNSNETPRTIAKEISQGTRKPQHIGVKSLEVKKQEFISHIQNFQETFTNAEKKEWLHKKDELVRALES